MTSAVYDGVEQTWGVEKMFEQRLPRPRPPSLAQQAQHIKLE